MNIFKRHKKQLHQTNQPLKALLWRKKISANYHFLAPEKTNPYLDLAEGFEIQSPPKEFISWDLPFAELKRHKAVSVDINGYLAFKYPVRMGELLLKKLNASTAITRKDMPVLNFYTHCREASNSDRSFTELGHYLKNYPGMKTLSSWGDMQKHQQFLINGLRLEVYYQYTDAYSFESGATHLSITNTRDYPDLLVDEPYESQLVVSKTLVFKKEIQLYGDYRTNKRIKRCPNKIRVKYGSQPVVWSDDVNCKIGFAQGGFSQVFDQKEVKAFQIQNILPAKGGGYADFYVLLKNEKYRYLLLRANCNGFDEYAAVIKNITRKEVGFGPEGINN